MSNPNFGKIAVIGSTAHTVQCAQAILAAEPDSIAWILTPTPRPTGREQLLHPNPLHQLAIDHHLPVILLEKKIDETVQDQIRKMNETSPVDFLLVVDFGYLIPSWLLELPKKSALNIHPSALPKWRGSSPGQFCLLYDDEESAVTVMQMDEGLDTGPIIIQLPFTVSKTWTQSEYYQHSFDLVSQQLPDILTRFALGTLAPQAQPGLSPTPLARQLNRADGFVDWQLLQVLSGETLPGSSSQAKNFETLVGETSPLLIEANQTHHSWPKTIACAIRAFQPWPTVWTILPTPKGPKRAQILSVKSTTSESLEIENVKIEGQKVAQWKQVKNIVQ